MGHPRRLEVADCFECNATDSERDDGIHPSISPHPIERIQSKTGGGRCKHVRSIAPTPYNGLPVRDTTYNGLPVRDKLLQSLTQLLNYSASFFARFNPWPRGQAVPPEPGLSATG